jgi:hypothetical protein
MFFYLDWRLLLSDWVAFVAWRFAGAKPPDILTANERGFSRMPNLKASSKYGRTADKL